MPIKGLLERLNDGEAVLVAEGYLFEFERRGYLKCGPYVPEVVLERPDLVKGLHEEFVHAGSDVVLAFTHYAHRAKLRLIGREDELEKMNRQALAIAKEVADATGTLMAGNINNTTIYSSDDEKVKKEIKQIFKEQIEWIKEAKADFIVAETFHNAGEAYLAMEAMNECCPGLPVVIMLAPSRTNTTPDGVPCVEACKVLEEMGADVVGLNCSVGPDTMLEYIKEIREAVKCHVAALPCIYRTDKKYPVFHSLPHIDDGKGNAFPTDLNAWQSSRKSVRNFAIECKEMGVNYFGMCCGGASCYMREIAEGIGRQPPASRFSSDVSLHWACSEDLSKESKERKTIRESWKY